MLIEDRLNSLKDRIQVVTEREVFLSVLSDIFQLLRDDQCNLNQYLSLLNVLVGRFHPALFGLLTENEFHERFARIFVQRFPQETLAHLICSLSTVPKSNSYMFEKLISLVEIVLQTQLMSILCTPLSQCEAEDLGRLQFTRALASFPDRIFNFFEYDRTKNLSSNSMHVAFSIIARFHELLIDAIKCAVKQAIDEPIDIDLCSMLVADLTVNSSEIAKKFILSLLEENSSNDWTIVYQKLFLSEHSEPKRREQLLVLLVHWLRSSDQLYLVFGDLVIKNPLLRRILTQRILVDKPQNSLPEIHQLVSKVVGYIAMVDKEVLKSTFIHLLRIWCDQAKLLHISNFQQQLQLSVALILVAKNISQEDRKQMVEDVNPMLLRAIPEYLKLIDTSRRQMGMLIAETLINYFKCTDQELHFDYNNDDRLLQQLKDIIKDGPSNSVSALSEKLATLESKEEYKPQSQDRKVKIEPTILDSDDDDEAECSDKAFVESMEIYLKNPKNRPNYLRDCLEQLTEKENYKRFASALTEIPRLIHERAIGFDDLALQLMESLLFLENRFNLPNFSELRSEAMELCFVRRPELVSYAVRILFSQNCSMSERFFILEAMEGAAKRFSEMRDVKKDVNLKKSDSVGEVGKVIRRNTQPKSLEYSMNPFSDVVPQFVYPLLNIKELGSHLKVENIDQALSGKILLTISKILVYAQNSPAIIRIASTLSPVLYALRRSEDSFVVHGCLCCYAALIDSIPKTALLASFETEIMDWVDFCESLMESKQVEADPLLRNSIDFTLHKIISVINKERL